MITKTALKKINRAENILCKHRIKYNPSSKTYYCANCGIIFANIKDTNIDANEIDTTGMHLIDERA